MKLLLMSNLLFITSLSLIGMEIDILKNRYENSVYKVMKKSEEKKNILIYKKCIVKLLPHELCKQIDAIYASMINEKIKKAYTEHSWTEKTHNLHAPILIISNDGDYFTHNVFFPHAKSIPKLINTQNNTLIREISSYNNKPIHFSSNNNYCITKEICGLNFYNIFYNLTDKKTYTLSTQKNHCYDITISNDGQHILSEERLHDSVPIYKLWKLDAQGIPQPTLLKDGLIRAKKVIFHPNNKQLIINYGGNELHLYTIATAEDIIIKQKKDNNVFAMYDMTFTHDDKKIIAKRDLIDYGEHDYAIINIEDLDKVTSVIISAQSCHETKELPILSIPCKNMLTHITNKGRTLELLDEKAQLIASHIPTNNAYITALAVDKHGYYIAAGYSDGTIMIWNLCNHNPKDFEKIFIKSNGAIKSLTFSDNQLLLSQSELGEFWNTSEPTSTPGQAILWDMYGNKVINFGDNILTSIMSPNGKTIVVVEAEVKPTNHCLSPWDRFLKLTAYHNKNKTTPYAPNNDLTLLQLYILMMETKKS